MNKADLSRQEISSITKRLLDKINKQHEPTPTEKIDQAIFNKTWNPEPLQNNYCLKSKANKNYAS